MRVTAKIDGVSEALEGVKRFTQRLQKEIDLELHDAANNMVNGAVADAPTDQGFLKNNITFKKVSDMNYEVVSQAFYSPYLEFGTRTYAKVPAGLEKVAAKYRGKAIGQGGLDELFLAIIDWVKRKGLTGRYSVKTKKRLGGKNDQLAEDFDVAYPIVIIILRKGIKPHPFFYKQLDKEKPGLLKRLKQIVENG